MEGQEQTLRPISTVDLNSFHARLHVQQRDAQIYSTAWSDSWTLQSCSQMQQLNKQTKKNTSQGQSHIIKLDFIHH